MDHSKERTGKFFEAGRNSAIVLDFVEEHFNQRPLAVYVKIVLSGFLPIRSRWYYGDASASFDLTHKFVAVVALVSKNVLGLYITAVEKLRSRSDIRNVASGQMKPEWIAQGIYKSVDFCGESTPRPAERLLCLPPLLPRHTDGHGWRYCQSSVILPTNRGHRAKRQISPRRIRGSGIRWNWNDGCDCS